MEKQGIEYWRAGTICFVYINKEMYAHKVINSVCQMFGITKEQLVSKCRKTTYADARAVVAKQLRKKEFPFAAIGIFINRSHSTIINAIKHYDDLFETDKQFTEKAKRVINE